MTPTVRRAADRRPSRWRNGGGTTYEVLSGRPPDDPERFDWRISLAELQEAGPFSAFPDVDRLLVLVDGSARLVVDGTPHLLPPQQPFRFDGAADASCELPAGAALALDVMTRRGRYDAGVDVLHCSGSTSLAAGGARPLVLLLLTGELAIEAAGWRAGLAALDALSWTDPAGSLSLRGAATVAVVRCCPRR